MKKGDVVFINTGCKDCVNVEGVILDESPNDENRFYVEVLNPPAHIKNIRAWIHGSLLGAKDVPK